MSVTPIRKTETLGGSDAAAASGIHPHHSRVALWLEKTGRIERPVTEAMEWGTALEPVIVARLEEDGWFVRPWPVDEAQDEARPWLVGHPDGIAAEQGTVPRLLEVKTANQWAARTWDGVPVEYDAQCQVYMHLTGLDRALLAVLVGGQRLELHELRRNERAIALLLDRLEEFHHYLLKDEPPPPDGSDSTREALLALFPEATAGRRIRLGRKAMEAVETLRVRKAQLTVLKRQVTELENALKATMGDAETAIDMHDRDTLRWTSFPRHSFDSERFRRDHPDLYAEYLTETTQRRFTVV